ncbi:MAG: hypothetical protein IKP27_07445 [Paludibacteraceae bacterium]|nr:hypothetical protein [Paludibacteraceae bacterium]
MNGRFLTLGVALATSLISCQKPAEYVEKVYPIQEEVELKLAGKWEIATVDNVPVLTNEKQVVTYQEGWTAFRSASDSAQKPSWMEREPMSCSIYGNDITENINTAQPAFLKVTSNVETITEEQMTANVKQIHSSSDTAQSHFIVYRKIDKDFSKDIVGLWEGKLALPGIPGVTDHRWDFREDGTFLSFDRDTINDEWVVNHTTTNQYMVDGTWLAMRKQALDPARDSRECWDISVEGDKMYWSALRADSVGLRHEDQMELTRIVE